MFNNQKRDKEFTVKQISNGFLFTFSGTDENESWNTEEMYVDTITNLEYTIGQWTLMPIQK